MTPRRRRKSSRTSSSLSSSSGRKSLRSAQASATRKAWTRNLRARPYRFGGDTGFSQIKTPIVSTRDSGVHSETSHHRWTFTITNLLASGFTVAVTRDDIESPLFFYWMVIGV